MEFFLSFLYSLVLSMLITKLLSILKRQIKKLIQEKAKERIVKLRKKMLERFGASKFSDKLSSAAKLAGKAKKHKAVFESSGIKGILEYTKTKK